MIAGDLRSLITAAGGRYVDSQTHRSYTRWKRIAAEDRVSTIDVTAMETTHGDGGEVGLRRRQQAAATAAEDWKRVSS